MSKRSKVGAIVRPSNSGLGNLAWEFFRHDIIHKCLLQPAEKNNDFPERFGEETLRCKDTRPNDEEIDWLLDGIDTVFLFETPYSDQVIPRARARGIKTILMPMHEGEAGWRGQRPDLWVCVSDLEYNLNLPGEKIRLNLPVNTDVLPYRERGRVKTFIHNAGHAGMMFRNGTPELIKALEFTDTPFKLIIRSQTMPFDVKDPRVEYEYVNYENYWDLWDEGEAFILPDKFSGLSMPLQEAFASGYLVLTTDREPLNGWLPRKPLFPHMGTSSHYGYYVDIPNPVEIAKAMDAWYDKDISEYSRQGLKWAEENSWQKLKPKYIEICKNEK